MLGYLATLPYRLSYQPPDRTDIPVPNPKAPSSKDIIHKGNDFSDWLSHRGGSFWTIAVIIVAALVATALLKRPFVKGIVIGVIVLAIIIAAMKA